MANSKKYFNNVAEKWDEMRKDFFSDELRNLAYSKADIKKGKLAVDMGSGTGFISEGLLKNGLNVIAVDQSEEMLNIMKDKFSEYSKIQYINSDIEKLPVEDNFADYVFANMFLHHVEYPEKAIREMTRILKKGGKLVIIDLDKHEFEFLRTEQFDRWMGFDREDLKNWFSNSGLNNIVVECAGCDCCADSEKSSKKAKVSVFIATAEK
ncbi:ubiquinone/menaquinone biosynthesis C-methylase UbiE [Methanococcus maripaludis]|uniref:Ubiquinone/menaquinone biosynthesis C-methylase UbiE n=1 Tax=Methanococcus maripaludis TaxID=39152 RepID=A0A7J9PC45_METMI|nr:class I SAM-dependent methyltransferase [Methanococcus maripaludis]MBA2860803.1 ubiquinone/menaquinone biosynthesis C-methylase UbiE [Methanococcus maripaludis]MBB6402376.1 ubiquinone/menaquinone biosynthesis C-methylase UbiE [Methanococcus maripaludis]